MATLTFGLSYGDIGTLLQGGVVSPEPGLKLVIAKSAAEVPLSPIFAATGCEIKAFVYDEAYWELFLGNQYIEEEDGELQLQSDTGKWLLSDSDSYDLGKFGPLLSYQVVKGRQVQIPFLEAFNTWRQKKANRK